MVRMLALSATDKDSPQSVRLTIEKSEKGEESESETPVISFDERDLKTDEGRGDEHDGGDGESASVEDEVSS